MKNYENLFYFIFAATLSLSGRGEYCCNPAPTPKFFSRQKFLKLFFHRYMGIWTKGRWIDRMEVLVKTQKWYEGKSERGVATTPPPSWERGLSSLILKVNPRKNYANRCTSWVTFCLRSNHIIPIIPQPPYLHHHHAWAAFLKSLLVFPNFRGECKLLYQICIRYCICYYRTRRRFLQMFTLFTTFLMPRSTKF